MKSTLTGMRRIRTGLVAGLALLALTGTVAGCSSDSEDEPIEGTETGSSEGENGANEDEGEEADVTALTNLYEAYWDAMIELENGEELDVTVFDGIATQGVTEEEVGRVQTLKDSGLRREGEPSIENVTVTVDGDEARIEACKNEDGWDVANNGEVVPGVVPENLLEPHAHVVTAERSSGDWLINATLPREEATISCS